MFKHILQFIPKMDEKEFRNMEKKLSGRFTKIAKGFGKGLANIFKGGGWIGAALGVLNKLLSPLKEVQDALDDTLKKSGDLKDNAEQFGTSSGNLFKLQQLAGAKGIEAEQLYTLISKFQSGVAEASQDPNKPHVLSKYVGTEDMAEGFYQFIQSLQKIDKNQQILIQEQVFGEKQVLKMAAFMNENLPELEKRIGARSGDSYTKSINNIDSVADQVDVNRARNALRDMQTKGGIINQSFADTMNQAEIERLKRENENLRNYNSLASLDNTMNKIMGLLEQGMGKLGEFISWITPTMNRMLEAIENFSKGPFARGVMKMFGKGKGE